MQNFCTTSTMHKIGWAVICQTFTKVRKYSIGCHNIQKLWPTFPTTEYMIWWNCPFIFVVFSFSKHIHSTFPHFFAIRLQELVICCEFQNICHKWSPDPPFSPPSSGICCSQQTAHTRRSLGKSLGQCCPGRAGASPRGPGCSRNFAGRRLAARLTSSWTDCPFVGRLQSTVHYPSQLGTKWKRYYWAASCI